METKRRKWAVVIMIIIAMISIGCGKQKENLNAITGEKASTDYDNNIVKGPCKEIQKASLEDAVIQIGDMYFEINKDLTMRDIFDEFEKNNTYYELSAQRTGIIASGETNSLVIKKDGIELFRIFYSNETEETIAIEDAKFERFVRWYDNYNDVYNPDIHNYEGCYYAGGFPLDGKNIYYNDIKELLKDYNYDEYSKGKNIYVYSLKYTDAERELEYEFYIDENDGHLINTFIQCSFEHRAVVHDTDVYEDVEEVHENNEDTYGKYDIYLEHNGKPYFGFNGDDYIDVSEEQDEVCYTNSVNNIWVHETETWLEESKKIFRTNEYWSEDTDESFWLDQYVDTIDTPFGACRLYLSMGADWGDSVSI